MAVVTQKPVAENDNELPHYEQIVLHAITGLPKLRNGVKITDITKCCRLKIFENLIIASLGNSYSANGLTLSKVISMLFTRVGNTPSHNNQNVSQLVIKGNIKRLKF